MTRRDAADVMPAMRGETIVRLDKEGEPGTTAGLLAAFGATRPWLDGELTFLDDVDGLEAAEQSGSVRLYPEGLSTDEPVETAGGPFMAVVNGDLVTSDHVHFGTDDYIPGLIVVTGDLHAETLFFASGARVIVEGSVRVAQACFGRWGDENALLDVQGELETPVLVLDGYTPAFARRGVRTVTCNSLGWWDGMTPDILPTAEKDYFRPELLDRHGDLDWDLAYAAAREGLPLLRPGAEESFPQRLEARATVSGY
ncbi:hypothetical protein [Catenulispora rubra]|uniref:hypothetical protein n=1 Tax=Catenulispora rubra TaxID=280293 RepID=UPI001891F8F0|nr:hypothetical protein [Catenulispora rubra]